MEYKTKIQNFTDLDVWKNSHLFVINIYKISKNFPEIERFGLTSQIRRSAVSITSNIAEGFGRRSAKDKSHFYQMSLGSLYECHSQLLLAQDLDLLVGVDLDGVYDSITTISKLLNGIIKSIQSPVIHTT
jgi:four helix bundle protein